MGQLIIDLVPVHSFNSKNCFEIVHSLIISAHFPKSTLDNSDSNCESNFDICISTFPVFIILFSPL